MADRAETQTPVFTEEEVHMIAGYLAEWWNVPDHPQRVEEVDSAIQEVLSRGE